MLNVKIIYLLIVLIFINLFSKRNCKNCSIGCDICLNFTNCLQCSNGYTFQQPFNNQCIQACSAIQNCQKCSKQDTNICEECVNGYFLISSNICSKSFEYFTYNTILAIKINFNNRFSQLIDKIKISVQYQNNSFTLQNFNQKNNSVNNDTNQQYTSRNSDQNEEIYSSPIYIFLGNLKDSFPVGKFSDDVNIILELSEESNCKPYCLGKQRISTKFNRLQCKNQVLTPILKYSNENSEIFLEFKEELDQEFTQIIESIIKEISIEGMIVNKDFNYIIKQNSPSLFSIQLVLYIPITNSPKLLIEFEIPNALYSICQTEVKNKNLQILLKNNYILSKQTQQIINKSSDISQILVYLALLMFLIDITVNINSTIAVRGIMITKFFIYILLNQQQYNQFITINYPPNISQIFQVQKDPETLIFKNLPKFSKNEKTFFPESMQLLGIFEFLIDNFSDVLAFTIICYLFGILLQQIKKFIDIQQKKNKKQNSIQILVQKLHKKLYQIFVWEFIILFIMSKFNKIAIFSLISIRFISFKSAITISSFLFGLIIIIGIIKMTKILSKSIYIKHEYTVKRVEDRQLQNNANKKRLQKTQSKNILKILPLNQNKSGNQKLKQEKQSLKELKEQLENQEKSKNQKETISSSKNHLNNNETDIQNPLLKNNSLEQEKEELMLTNINKKSPIQYQYENDDNNLNQKEYVLKITNNQESIVSSSSNSYSTPSSNMLSSTESNEESMDIEAYGDINKNQIDEAKKQIKNNEIITGGRANANIKEFQQKYQKKNEKKQQFLQKSQSLIRLNNEQDRKNIKQMRAQNLIKNISSSQLQQQNGVSNQQLEQLLKEKRNKKLAEIEKLKQIQKQDEKFLIGQWLLKHINLTAARKFDQHKKKLLIEEFKRQAIINKQKIQQNEQNIQISAKQNDCNNFDINQQYQQSIQHKKDEQNGYTERQMKDQEQENLEKQRIQVLKQFIQGKKQDEQIQKEMNSIKQDERLLDSQLLMKMIQNIDNKQQKQQNEINQNYLINVIQQIEKKQKQLQYIQSKNDNKLKNQSPKEYNQSKFDKDYQNQISKDYKIGNNQQDQNERLQKLEPITQLEIDIEKQNLINNFINQNIKILQEKNPNISKDYLIFNMKQQLYKNISLKMKQPKIEQEQFFEQMKDYVIMGIDNEDIKQWGNEIIQNCQDFQINNQNNAFFNEKNKEHMNVYIQENNNKNQENSPKLTKNKTYLHQTSFSSPYSNNQTFKSLNNIEQKENSYQKLEQFHTPLQNLSNNHSQNLQNVNSSSMKLLNFRLGNQITKNNNSKQNSNSEIGSPKKFDVQEQRQKKISSYMQKLRGRQEIDFSSKLSYVNSEANQFMKKRNNIFQNNKVPLMFEQELSNMKQKQLNINKELQAMNEQSVVMSQINQDNNFMMQTIESSHFVSSQPNSMISISNLDQQEDKEKQQITKKSLKFYFNKSELSQFSTPLQEELKLEQLPQQSDQKNFNKNFKLRKEDIIKEFQKQGLAYRDHKRGYDLSNYVKYQNEIKGRLTRQQVQNLRNNNVFQNLCDEGVIKKEYVTMSELLQHELKLQRQRREAGDYAKSVIQNKWKKSQRREISHLERVGRKIGLTLDQKQQLEQTKDLVKQQNQNQIQIIEEPQKSQFTQDNDPLIEKTIIQIDQPIQQNNKQEGIEVQIQQYTEISIKNKDNEIIKQKKLEEQADDKILQKSEDDKQILQQNQNQAKIVSERKKSFIQQVLSIQTYINFTKKTYKEIISIISNPNKYIQADLYRHFIMEIILIFLFNFAVISAILSFILNILFLCYLIKIRPFKTKKQFKITILLEIFIDFIILLFLILAIFDIFKLKTTVARLFVGWLVLLMLIGIYAVLIANNYFLIANLIRKNKQKQHLKKINPQALQLQPRKQKQKYIKNQKTIKIQK